MRGEGRFIGNRTCSLLLEERSETLEFQRKVLADLVNISPPSSGRHNFYFSIWLRLRARRKDLLSGKEEEKKKHSNETHSTFCAGRRSSKQTKVGDWLVLLCFLLMNKGTRTVRFFFFFDPRL